MYESVREKQCDCLKVQTSDRKKDELFVFERVNEVCFTEGLLFREKVRERGKIVFFVRENEWIKVKYLYVSKER